MATSEPGDLIYQQRRRRGWSKTQLCEEIQSWEYRHGNEETLGLNPNYVREWERGERSVSDHYAPKLAAVLELPIEIFVDRRSRRGRVPVSREAEDAGTASSVAGEATEPPPHSRPPRPLREIGWFSNGVISPCSARWDKGFSTRSLSLSGA
jgi:transcriptional regulator with XRE-family HTH domain